MRYHVSGWLWFRPVLRGLARGLAYLMGVALVMLILVLVLIGYFQAVGIIEKW